MGRRNSREDIAATLVSIVEETSSLAVSVVDLSKEVGCSRKTFYRYFDDIDDVIVWFYRDSMRRIVEANFADEVLVRPDLSLGDKYDWPFYARIIAEDGFLEQGPYFEKASAHFERHPKYYEVVFRQKRGGYYDFQRYFCRLFAAALRDDIVLMAKGKIITPAHIDFLAEYHAGGLAGRLEQFVCERNALMSGENGLHWNYAHEVIRRDLQGYFARAESTKG